jgi:hypothetical protein
MATAHAETYESKDFSYIVDFPEGTITELIEPTVNEVPPQMPRGVSRVSITACINQEKKYFELVAATVLESASWEEVAQCKFIKPIDVLDITIKRQLGREYFEPIERTISNVVGIHQSRECITFAFARTRYSETYWVSGMLFRAGDTFYELVAKAPTNDQSKQLLSAMTDSFSIVKAARANESH